MLPPYWKGNYLSFILLSQFSTRNQRFCFSRERLSSVFYNNISWIGIVFLRWLMVVMMSIASLLRQAPSFTCATKILLFLFLQLEISGKLFKSQKSIVWQSIQFSPKIFECASLVLDLWTICQFPPKPCDCANFVLNLLRFCQINPKLFDELPIWFFQLVVIGNYWRDGSISADHPT